MTTRTGLFTFTWVAPGGGGYAKVMRITELQYTLLTGILFGDPNDAPLPSVDTVPDLRRAALALTIRANGIEAQRQASAPPADPPSPRTERPLDM